MNLLLYYLFIMIETKLKKFGIKITKQRMEIASILFDGESKHFSADDLYNLTEKKNLQISLATIYNTLKEFSNLGLIKEIIIDPNRIWYDTFVNNHYHFYNSATNQLIDIPEAQIKVSKLPSIPKGHKIDQMNVVIHLQRKD